MGATTTGKLAELERRLKDEPENLGLRVSLAGALHDAGRKDEAVELYRSVAIVYRDQGRAQQAIAVCRSILEIAPDDARCTSLLGELTGEGAPKRRSSMDETPLPRPLPYHVADPTTKSLEKLSAAELPDAELPTSEGADTRPGAEATPPPQTGIAAAARRISRELIASTDAYEAVDVTAELETRQRPRISSGELQKILQPPPTAPVVRVDFDDAPTAPPVVAEPHDTEEELTVPRDLPLGTQPPSARDLARVRDPVTSQSTAMLAAALFAPLPAARRAAVLSRFHRRTARPGETVIRQGEPAPPLVLVGRGRLEVRIERAGQLALVESVGAGDYIGEAALLARTAAAAHVIAATEAELLVLLPHDFYEIAGAYPALWAQLKDTAARRGGDRR